MIWRIPVTWQMTGTQEIEADRLEDAMKKAYEDFNATDGEFKDGTLELDCYDVDVVREIYNKNIPDHLRLAYPELGMYERSDDGGFQTDLIRNPDDIPGDELGRYEIIFDLFGERYYCFCDAVNVGEALGQFFVSHPHITYDMIVDHIEV